MPELLSATSSVDFNPLSPHGERRPTWRGRKHGRAISIHSPRMGRDEAKHVIVIKLGMQFQSTLPAWGETQGVDRMIASIVISIHSPRMGRDRRWGRSALWQPGFQSTLPAWGETYYIVIDDEDDQISIHSPRMGRDA